MSGPRGCVVVGTDTEVGKTVVSAALLLRLLARRPCEGNGAPEGAQRPPRLGYWKPIATGARDGRDVATAAYLLDGAPGIDLLPESYLFEAPVSPHLAARLEGRTLDVARVVRDFAGHRAAAPERALLVEAVGGLLVPLTDDGVLLPSLLAALGLPCVLVARSTLGTINHTLLTLEAARARQLDVVGVVLNGPPDTENRRAIERWGGVPVLGELPRLEPLAPGALRAAARTLDPDGLLMGLFHDDAA